MFVVRTIPGGITVELKTVEGGCRDGVVKVLAVVLAMAFVANEIEPLVVGVLVLIVVTDVDDVAADVDVVGLVVVVVVGNAEVEAAVVDVLVLTVVVDVAGVGAGNSVDVKVAVVEGNIATEVGIGTLVGADVGVVIGVV